MTTRYEVRPYAAPDRQAVLDLQTHLWSPDAAVREKYFQWKYERTPFDCDPIFYLAFDGARLIGVRGAMPALWQAGGAAHGITLLAAGDTVVDPDYRRQGLFGQIMAHMQPGLRERGHDLLLNMSAGEITAIASRKIGWRHVHPYDTMARPPEAVSVGRLPVFDGPLPEPLTVEGCSGIRVSAAPEPSGMAGLVASLPYDGRLRLDRTQRYFAWRFDNPLCRYRFLFSGDDAIEGYLVLQRSIKATGAVNIIDWEAADSRSRQRLLEAAARLCAAVTMRIWTVSLGDRDKQILGDAGFAPVDMTDGGTSLASGLLVRHLHDDAAPENWTVAGRPALDPASWDLRQLCSDGA